MQETPRSIHQMRRLEDSKPIGPETSSSVKYTIDGPYELLKSFDLICYQFKIMYGTLPYEALPVTKGS